MLFRSEEKLLNHCDNKRGKKCKESEHQVNRRSYFYIVKGKELIKAKQQAENIKVQRRMSKRNSYLYFLRNNFKKGKENNPQDNKCRVGKDCDDNDIPNKM